MGREIRWVKKQNKRNKEWRWEPDNGTAENEECEHWSQSDFDDAVFSLCTVRSTHKPVPTRSSSDTQTEPITSGDGEAQTDWTSRTSIEGSKEIQTEPVQDLQSSDAGVGPDGAPTVDAQAELPAEVGSFVRLAFEEHIEKALQENSLSHALSSLQITWGDSSDFEGVVRHRLQPIVTEATISAVTSCKDVTSVSFNSTGNKLAIGLGDLKQQGWCGIQSSILIWDIRQLEERVEADSMCDRQTSAEAFQPSAILELPTSNFITCLKFHPEEPATLVSGSYSGELMSWDLGADDKNDPLQFTSRISDHSHREPVSSIEWVRDKKEDAFQVASIGTDGRLLLWTRANKFDTPIIGFTLACIRPREGPRMPAAASSDNSSIYVVPNVSKERILGGTSMAFYPRDRSVVVVGCESGAVLRCSFLTHDTDTTIRQPTEPEAIQSNVEWTHRAQALIDNVPSQQQVAVRRKIERDAVTAKKDKITLQFILGTSNPDIYHIFPSPVPFAFVPHQGPVQDISFSPHHRHLFLTCSTDGSARIYHTLQPRPIILFEAPCMSYLYAACWSPVRPTVFAVVSGAGFLYLFDLQVSSKNNKTASPNPVLKLKVSQNEDVALISLSWREQDSSVLTIGTADGQTVLIEVNEAFYKQRSGEEEALNKIAEEALGSS
jgi:WD40 repeat protein